MTKDKETLVGVALDLNNMAWAAELLGHVKMSSMLKEHASNVLDVAGRLPEEPKPLMRTFPVADMSATLREVKK